MNILVPETLVLAAAIVDFASYERLLGDCVCGDAALVSDRNTGAKEG